MYPTFLFLNLQVLMLRISTLKASLVRLISQANFMRVTFWHLSMRIWNGLKTLGKNAVVLNAILLVYPMISKVVATKILVVTILTRNMQIWQRRGINKRRSRCTRPEANYPIATNLCVFLKNRLDGLLSRRMKLTMNLFRRLDYRLFRSSCRSINLSFLCLINVYYR